jgi:hypothetical protein
MNNQKVYDVTTPQGLITLVPVTSYQQDMVYKSDCAVYALPSRFESDEWRGVKETDIKEWAEINGFSFTYRMMVVKNSVEKDVRVRVSGE